MEALETGVKMRNVLVPKYISMSLAGECSDFELWIPTNMEAFSACISGEIAYFKNTGIQRYCNGQMLKVFARVSIIQEECSQALYPRVCLAGFWRLQLE